MTWQHPAWRRQWTVRLRRRASASRVDYVAIWFFGGSRGICARRPADEMIASARVQWSSSAYTLYTAEQQTEERCESKSRSQRNPCSSTALSPAATKNLAIASRSRSASYDSILVEYDTKNNFSHTTSDRGNWLRKLSAVFFETQMTKPFIVHEMTLKGHSSHRQC